MGITLKQHANVIADLGTYTKTGGSQGTLGDTAQLGDIDLREDTFLSQFTDTVPLTSEARVTGHAGERAGPGVEGGGVSLYSKKDVNVETQKRIPFAVEAILAGSILLGLTVAVMSPNTVLTDSPILRAFTDFMASLIPGIDRLAKVSQFPEVTRFTSAVLWATVPLQALVSAYPGVYVFRMEIIRQRKLFAFICWVTMPLLVLLMASVSIQELSPEKLARKNLFAWGLRSVSESRAWLGVIGGAVAYSAAVCIFGFFAWWPRTRAIYFGPKN